MGRIVQSTTCGSEKDFSVRVVGEQVKSTQLHVVRVCTPKDIRSWCRFVSFHGLSERYSIVERIGPHPESGMPRAIAVSLQATESVHAALRAMRICRDEKQECTRWDTFQSTKVSRGGVGCGPELTRKVVPAKLQYMTPTERKSFLNREPGRESYHVGNPDILIGKFLKLLRES